MKLKRKQSQKLKLQRYLVTASLIILFGTIGGVILIEFGDVRENFAASNGDYRTKASGNWNSTSTWEKYSGGSWNAATTTPTSSDGTITIQSGHTVMVTANVTVDQVVIDAGGQLTVSSGTITVNNGSGTDLTVNGTLSNSATISLSNSATCTVSGTASNSGTINNGSSTSITLATGGRFIRQGGTIPTTSSFWILNDGSTFEHAMNGGTIPSITWNNGTTCEVTGITNSVLSGLNQSFNNFIWNCPNQVSDINLGGNIQTVQKDFTIASTGSGNIFIDQQGNNSTLDIGGNINCKKGNVYVTVNGSSVININNGGNLNVTGGLFAFNQSGATGYGNTSTTINITGNLNVNGGTLDLSQCSSNNSSKGIGIINLQGNISISDSGSITETGNSKGQIYLAGNGNDQRFISNGNLTNTIDFIVNANAVLRMDNQVITGDGSFTVNSTGCLMVGHPAGITKTSLSGNVQCTGIRSYSSGADYTYSGTAAQVTGDGLPSQERNLTLNNPNNCTLTASTTTTGTQYFISGIWIATNDTLTLGTGTANLGTLSRTDGHVYGYYRRWIAATTASNVLFPVGTLQYYNGANFSFTTAPTTAGSIVSTFIPVGPGTLGLPLLDAGDLCENVGYGYWNFGSMNSLAGGAWSVNLFATGFPGIADYTKLHVFRRTGSGSPWTINGTHTAGTVINNTPVANRVAMNVFGNYGIVSGPANVLPVTLVSFEAKLKNENNRPTVFLSWKTAAEINNDFFTVEKSSNGKDFMQVSKTKGAGNSTTIHLYTSTDENPSPGYSYYRLKQTDFDGKFTYSNIRVVNNSGEVFDSDRDLAINKIFPVPFDDHFVMIFNSISDDDLTFTLLGTDGKIYETRRIHASSGSNELDFDSGEKLPSGTYIVSLTGSASKATKTIVRK